MDPKLFQEIECEERLPDLTDEELAELENSFDEFAEVKRVLDELDRQLEELEELERLLD
jgi:Tfp pilus assembly protein PilO